MKKTKIISLLSALLAAIMLFASCSNPFGGDGKSDAEYEANVAAWFEYLEYDADYAKNRFYNAPSEILQYDSESTKIVSFSTAGLVAIKKYTFDTSNSTLIGNEYKVPASVSYTVYDLIEEKTVWSASVSETVAFETYDYGYYLDLQDAVSFEASTKYGFAFDSDIGFFKVAKEHTYTPEPTEEIPSPASVTEYTYTVYDVKGNELYTGDEDVALDAREHLSTNGYTLYEVVIGENKYITRGTEIIYVTESYDNRKLPAVNASADGYHYAWFFDNSISNDFVVQIFDKDYKFVSENRFEYVDEAYAKLLPNGSLLVFTLTALSGEATEYDVITPDGTRSNYSYYTITEDGKATELELPAIFPDEDMIVTPDSDAEYSFNVKAGYTLFAGYAVNDDKTITLSDMVFYVYDDEMNLVKELPEIVVGQYDLPYFTESDAVLFPVYTAATGYTAYRVAKDNFDYDYEKDMYVTSASRPTLFVDPSYAVRKGYFKDNILYNEYLERQRDLSVPGSTYDTQEIVNDNFYGAIMIRKSGSGYPQGGSYYLVYINDYGYAQENQIPQSYSGDGMFMKYYSNGTNYVADMYFNTLLQYGGSQSATFYTFYRGDVSGAYVRISGDGRSQFHFFK